MTTQIRNFLVKTAQARAVTTYTVLAEKFGFNMKLTSDRNKISKILYDISVTEWNALKNEIKVKKNDDPVILSSIVVRANDGKPFSLPGEGYFVMLEGPFANEIPNFEKRYDMRYVLFHDLLERALLHYGTTK